MASKFFTKTGEENFINTLIKNGLQISGLPKYYILRLAINKSFRLQHYPLDNSIWNHTIMYDGASRNECEYNYEQIIGRGKDKGDYENILKAMLAFKHRDENIDFSDDFNFEKTIEKYIHRGLLEIYNTYKSVDDFYQWLIDDFALSDIPGVNPIPSTDINEEYLRKYFKNNSLNIEILNTNNAPRHKVYKIRLNSQDDYKRLKKNIEALKMEFGLEGDAILEGAQGEAMTSYLYLPKPKNSWDKLNFNDFQADMKSYNKDYEIAVYCGRDMLNNPVFFDLVSCPHIFVGGTTGSGKSVLLKNIIVSIAKLNKNVEFVLIDPKSGAEFGIYQELVKLSEISDHHIIKDMDSVCDIFNKLIAQMESRYSELDSNRVQKNSELSNPFTNIIVVVDEVADMLSGDKKIAALIERLAQKARACGIFLILATQSPNSDIFTQTLRSNIPSRIALKTNTSNQSKVIMDETGAEKLLGAGDLYIKLNLGDKKLIFTPYIQDKNDLMNLLR